jgi:hypothetical protein
MRGSVYERDRVPALSRSRRESPGAERPRYVHLVGGPTEQEHPDALVLRLSQSSFGHLLAVAGSR